MYKEVLEEKPLVFSPLKYTTLVVGTKDVANEIPIRQQKILPVKGKSHQPDSLLLYVSKLTNSEKGTSGDKKCSANSAVEIERVTRHLFA